MAEVYHHLTGSAEYIRELKNYEKNLLPALRKKLNSQLTPILNPIENKARISLRPKDLIFIEGKGRGGDSLDGAVGFEYAELAGIQRRPPRERSKGWGSSSVGYHSYTYNGQGFAFNRKLRKEFGKPGRFLWKRVLKRKPDIEAKVQSVANDFGIKLSKRLS